MNISDDLRWNAHVDALCAKVASRLYFFKILKHSGLPQNDLLCFYKSVIRSVVEYGCVVWHHNLTTAQSVWLEALQKRALCIILHPVTVPYNTALALCESLLSCDDAIFSRNSLNRSAILGTVCMTSSHLNVILPFLTDCGILQFTPSLTFEQNGTAPL